MNLKIVEKAKIYFIVPAVIILLGVVFFFVNGGFVQDIDFAGGLTMTVDMGKKVDLNEISEVVKSADESIKNPKILRGDGNEIIIQTPPVESNIKHLIKDKLVEKYG